MIDQKTQPPRSMGSGEKTQHEMKVDDSSSSSSSSSSISSSISSSSSGMKQTIRSVKDSISSQALKSYYTSNPMTQKSDSMTITVNEPVKQGEGINAYISYKINTSTTRSGFKSTSFSVIRRFSDFVWLHTSLIQEFPGIIVPPLPDKLLVGRFSPEFIESRRRSLEKFLNRTAIHLDLRHSEHLKVFLEASDEGMLVFKGEEATRRQALQASRGMSTGIFQWLDEAVQQISSTLGHGAIMDKTPIDLQFEEMQAYIDALEPVLLDLQKHATGLTKRSREIADGLFDFGVAFHLLGQSEDSELGAGLGFVGSCTDQLSIFTAEQAEKEVLYFEEPIVDYIRLIASVKATLQKRTDLRWTYQTALGDAEGKKAICEKLMKHSGGKEEKLLQAQIDQTKAEERVDLVAKEYELVTERVLREMERFRIEKVSDFKMIILDYIQLQIDYNKKIEAEWEAIIPKLQAINIDSSSTSMSSDSSSASPATTTTPALLLPSYMETKEAI